MTNPTEQRTKELKDDLINEFSAAVKWASKFDLSDRFVSSLYELNVFKLIIDVARAYYGAQVTFIENGNSIPEPHEIKTGPHQICDGSYVYARLDFPSNSKSLEVHLGLKFKGKSTTPTECDVVVIGKKDADSSRRKGCLPLHKTIVFGVECKAYTKNIDLGMAREFVGLSSDLTIRHKDYYFVVSYPIVTNGKSLLDHHRKNKYVDEMVPKNNFRVSDLKHKICEIFSDRGY